MLVLWAATALLWAVAAQQPPSNVDLFPTGMYPWVQGVMQFNWTRVNYAVDGYRVVVDPLDYNNGFSTSRDLQDFVLSPGHVAHTIAVNDGTGQLEIGYSGQSWQSGTTPARGLAPFAIRKIPDGASIELSTIDCSAAPAGATSWYCGFVIYNAGTNVPLLTWMIGFSSAFNSPVVTYEAYAATQVVRTADYGRPWTLAGTQLRIERNTADNTKPWLLLARTNSSIPWSAVSTRITVLASQLDVFDWGDLWHGMGARATNGSTTAVGGNAIAVFDDFRMTMPIPATAPRDINGAVDVCLKTTNVQQVNVTVAANATAAVVAGLSTNFPYMVTVYAVIDNATGTLSAPSLPLEGTYFWARRAPPRQQRLALWLTAKWMPNGAITVWPDSSGNGHTVRQTSATTALRPTVVRSGTDIIYPGRVQFTRTAGTFMVGGSDSIDLGVTGPMTLYLSSRNRATTLQVVAGRGVMSNQWDVTPNGWLAGISSTIFDNVYGYFGMRVVDSNGTNAGGSARNTPITSPYVPGSYLAVQMGPADPNNAATLRSTYMPRYLPATTGTTQPYLLPLGNYSITGCFDAACTALTYRNFDTAVNNTLPGFPISVTYNGTVASPAINSHLAFHVGGPSVSGGNPMLAFDGDIYDLAIYRETHTLQQRQAVYSYLTYQAEYGCPRDISGPAVSGLTSQCVNGPAYANCYTGCQGGFSWFLGGGQDHICSAGVWTNVPLVCRRMCIDVLAPIYTQSCTRRWWTDDFNATRESWTMVKYYHWPLVPEYQRNRIWVHDTVQQVLRASTQNVDACDRVTGAASHLVPHNTRWSSFIPPANGLATTATADIVLGDANSTAGISNRMYDHNNHYRLEMRTSGLSIVRVSGGAATTIATSRNMTFTPGVPYRLSFGAKLRNFWVVMGNTTIMSVTDSGSFQTWGPGGFYIGALSRATFDNFTWDSDCDLGPVARYMYDGMQILFQCKPGYTVIGNTTWTCNPPNNYKGASLICLSQPPVPMPANFSVPELSKNNTYVGQVFAMPANIDQTISYQFIAQYPKHPNGTQAFTVSGCSGAIRVNDPDQLDFWVNPVFTVTIFAWPDSQTIAGTYFNATINLINVPTAPSLQDANLYVNATYYGPIVTNWVLFNRNKYPLSWQIVAGDTSPPTFALARYAGNMSVVYPGITWTPSNIRTLTLKVSAVGVTADIPLEGYSTVTITVLDVNVPPTFVNTPIFTCKEDVAVQGQYLGQLVASDPNSNNPDAPLGWANITFAIAANSNWRTFTNIFALTPDGALYMNANLTFDAISDYEWFNGRKARHVFPFAVSVCDLGGAGYRPMCTNATARVAVLAMNDSMLLSFIDGMPAPSSPLSTQGGEIIRFSGSDFPVGGVMVVTYASADKSLSFVATGCIVRSDNLAECRSSPGYGANLIASVIMDGMLVNSSAPLILSYAAPTIDVVTINSTFGLTTAGSADGAVIIRGSNFGPPGTPVTIKFGNVYEWDMVVAGNNNYTRYVTHTTITATMLQGCGARLPVRVVVAGQGSTCSDATNAGCTVSYPGPTLTAMVPSTNTFNVTSLLTLGGQRVILYGTNAGPLTYPASVGGAPVTVVVSYSDETNVFRYSMTCDKVGGLPHTALDCQTMPGVGKNLFFSANVCGQISPAVAVSGASYAPPKLYNVAGPGTNRASTEGGQIVTLRVDEAGPRNNIDSIPQAITGVRYGTPGVYQYAARNCYVSFTGPSGTSGGGSEVTCLSSPGTGYGHWWQITIGFQSSNILPKNSSYGAPILSFFTGPGSIDADTRAGIDYPVTINGFNMGADISLVSVSYTNTLTGKRASDGLVPSTPGYPAGIVRYEPLGCTFVTPHRALQCIMPPSAGQQLVWELVVDGQVSTAPTTSFSVPIITDVSLVDGGTTVTTDGGAMVVISGLDFGLAPLVQSIRFGPSGSEYAVASWTYVDHTQINATLGPGIGGPLSFIVTVADQVSMAFRSSLSYAVPIVDSVAPAVVPAVQDPTRPNLITVTGREFGLLNPDVQVEIAFGNPSDGNIMRLPVLSRTPTLAQVSSPTFNPGPSPVNQTVVFAAPTGLGSHRSIRIIQYLRGQQFADARITALAPQGAAATLTYVSPDIDFVFVYRVTSYENSTVLPALFPGLNLQDVAFVRRLEIRGSNFGPPASLNGDNIMRKLQLQPSGYPADFWSDALAAFPPANWTSERIDGYVLANRGAIKVLVQSMNFDATMTFNQSDSYEFSDVSPQIGALTGVPDNGYPTQGGPGSIVTVKASGLGGTVELNVTVGVSPLIAQCKLLNDASQYINNQAEAVAMLLSQTNNVLLNDFTYTIRCEVPPGQGKGVPVLVWRNGQPSGTTTANVNVISYQAPSITATGVFNPATGQFAMRNFPAFQSVEPPTSGADTVRLIGSNFGVCPTVTIFHDPTTTILTEISACLDDFDANNRAIKVPNPAVTWSHTFMEFKVPAGEGTGLNFNSLGWYIVLSAGDRQYRQEDNRQVLLRYQAPAITTISTPAPVDTRGGALLSIWGKNFGFMSTPVVRFVSPIRTTLTCGNVTRYSHSYMTCTVPPGSGAGLQVQITVADLVGGGGVFNYTTPAISSITLIPSGAVTPDLASTLRAGVYVNGSVWNATSILSPAVAPGRTYGPFLTASPHGGDVVVVDGLSFGEQDPINNCAFVGWAPAWADLVASDIASFPALISTGVPLCDSTESFLGEGEIHANTSVLYWNHTRVIFALPPGVGSRVITLEAGGQLPDAPARYNNLRYATAEIVHMQGRGQLSTSGGDPLDIFGWNIAPLTINGRNGTQRTYTFPQSLPLPRGVMMPTGQIRVDFGSQRSPQPCVATAYSASGVVAPGFSNCLMPGIRSITFGTDDSVTDMLTMTVPPGVGKNKPVTISYLSADGVLLARSNVGNFTYDPPRITSLYPDLILDNGQTTAALYLRGVNFGRLQDVPLMDADEQTVEVLLGNITCDDAQRVVKNQEDQVQCRLPAGMPVGFVNFTVNIAGQTGFLSSDSPYTLLIGCLPEYFAHFGEPCLPCPTGSVCRGFVTDESIGVTLGTTAKPFSPYSLVDVSNGSVKVGDVEVARRGYHTYPVPIAGFFNLNGTMADACPDMIRGQHPGRDVCIVGCVPTDACVGKNFCSEPYQSKAPYYRCAECNKGYYRSSGDCIKCPDSPYALVIGIVLVILGVATAGYFLNKYEFDIRIVSIGVDYFQVLAIFSQSKVSWPPEVKQLYRLLSAFNLNIEIVAPECLVPNMSYIQKFSAILALPYAVLIFFLLTNVARFLVYRYWYGQRDWKQHLRQMAGSISIALMLMFLFYLFSSRTILGIWECAPAKPDDGKRYLQVGTFEECGKPGGVQVTLIPWSVVGLIVLVAGYPISITVSLYLNRRNVMADQILRALRMEAPKGSDIALVRAALSRVYFQYKPQFAYFWIMAIITRKFFIAFSSLVFNQNSSYQLAFCVLILTLSFAAQMRCLPYMPASEFDSVLKDVKERSKTDAFWNQLRTEIIGLDALSKKKAHVNTMTATLGTDVYSVGSFIGRTLANYNTIEALLLLNAICVCLLGVLYTTVRPVDDYYETSRRSITINLMMLLVAGIIYFSTVFVLDIISQYNAKRIAAADARSQAAKKTKSKKSQRRQQGEAHGMDILRDGENIAESSSTTNPLFLRGDGSGVKDDTLLTMIRQTPGLPTLELWNLIKEHYLTITSQVGELTTQLNLQRSENQRMMDALRDLGAADAVLGGSAKGAQRPAAKGRQAPTRRVFEPQQGGGDDGAIPVKRAGSKSPLAERRGPSMAYDDNPMMAESGASAAEAPDADASSPTRSPAAAGMSQYRRINRSAQLASARRPVPLRQGLLAGDSRAKSIVVDEDD